MLSKAKTLVFMNILADMFPDARCELTHQNPFQLLIAVILSAQATDVSVNKVTPQLFADFPTPEALARGDIDKIMADIRTIGLYRNKAKNIKAASQAIVTQFNGEVPNNRTDLESLAGVGRKTASVVLGDAFGVPAIAVDTHVERVSKRLHICKQSATVKEVEEALMKKLPKDMWISGHHRLVLFGRYHCTARSPKCDICPAYHLCAFGQSRIAQ